MCPSFPSRHFLSSSSASPSRSTTTVQTCTRSRWLPSSAPASHWRESGRLTDAAPNMLIAVPELRWDSQCQEMPDDVNVEVDRDWVQCPRTRRSTAGGTSTCWAVTVSSSTRSCSAALSRVARGRERHGSKTLRSTRTSSHGAEGDSASGNRFECSSWDHSETWRRAPATFGEKDLWIQEKVRSHELRILRVKSEDTRADLLTKFMGLERHLKLIKLFPLSVRGTRRGLANSVALGVVCALSGLQQALFRKKVEKIEQAR